MSALSVLVYDRTKSLEQMVDDCRRAILEAALLDAGFNQCRAAERLGVHRNTLGRHCEELGLDAKALRRSRAPKKPPMSELARRVLEGAA